MKHKTAVDFRNDYQNLEKKRLALESKIRMRLRGLIHDHPNAIIGYGSNNVPLKANSLNNSYYLNGLSINSTLQYIEIIEKYLANLNPVKQLNLFDEICNCDGRDMPTYIEDGKRWCPQCGYEVKHIINK